MFRIVDPKTSDVFYANEEGRMSVSLPPDVAVLNSGGDEWWELTDGTNRYFYHVRTGRRTWDRPDGVVVPIYRVQKAAAGLKLESIVGVDNEAATKLISDDANSAGISKLVTENVNHGKSEVNLANCKVELSSKNAAPVKTRLNMTAEKSNFVVALAKSKGISNPVLNEAAAAEMHPLSKKQPGDSMGFTAIQNLPTLALPPGLQVEIKQFQYDGFAKKYFGERHRVGLFRRKMPLEDMMKFQKSCITGPLLALNSDLKKDAIKCFKLLQKILVSGNKPNGMMGVAADIQALCEKGIRAATLRDEIFAQTTKQLTGNPNPEQVKSGWALMALLTVTFPPSKNLEYYLRHFLEEHFDTDGHDSKTDVVIRYAHSSLSKTCKIGPRGRVHTLAELEQALAAPFKSSLFGDTLDNIMERQEKLFPGKELPIVLTVLAESILRLNGERSEGIFRVPGDAEEVGSNVLKANLIDLRAQMDKNEFTISDSIRDPNIPGSLLKLWLRELSAPLIPTRFYDGCVTVGKEEMSKEMAEILKSAQSIIAEIPLINQKVARYMIEFLQKIAMPQNQPFTKMTPANLAMVFAPNFLRCPVDDPSTIFQNQKHEQTFLKVLILDVVGSVKVEESK